jgi:predicted lipoprotein with Yx(FWY)xxD motif
MNRRPLAVVLAVALVLTIAACGSSGSSGSSDATATTIAVPATTTSTRAPSGTGTTLSTIPAGTATIDASSTSHGDVLVDLTGHTLYVFTNDPPSQSSCVAACATNWPPLTGNAIAVSNAVPTSANEFKLIARPDGTQQVTVNGRPLYTFAGDASPGDTNGQGVGGTWFVVGVDGQPIR